MRLPLPCTRALVDGILIVVLVHVSMISTRDDTGVNEFVREVHRALMSTLHTETY